MVTENDKCIEAPIEVQGLSASKPGWRFFAAFGCLCIINLACALEATILSVALPVWNFLSLVFGLFANSLSSRPLLLD